MKSLPTRATFEGLYSEIPTSRDPDDFLSYVYCTIGPHRMLQPLSESYCFEILSKVKWLDSCHNCLHKTLQALKRFSSQLN